jgi:hypothetical protein
MIDTSIFDSPNLNDRIQIAQIRHLRINKDPKNVLIRGFTGGKGGRQLEEFTCAMTKAQMLYEKQGYRIISEMHNQDTIKNVCKLTPTAFTDYVLQGDIHLYITHLHEGNVAKSTSWNIPNILANVDRLSHHLGNLMGVKNKCPIYRQGKMEVYEMLQDHCLPTLKIHLPLQNEYVWDETFKQQDIDNIRRYINISYLVTMYFYFILVVRPPFQLYSQICRKNKC